MPRIFIDTDELRSMAGGLQGDAAELGDVALALTGAWARTPAPPVQLVGLAARGGWTQARIGTLAAQLAAASASLRVEALVTEAEEIEGGLAAALGLTDAAFLAAVAGVLGSGVRSGDDLVRSLSSRVDALGDALVVKGSRVFMDSMEWYEKFLKRAHKPVGRTVSVVAKIAKRLKPFSVFLDGHTALTGFDDILRDERTDRPNWVETLQDSLDWGGSIMSLGSVGLATLAGGLALTVAGAPIAAGALAVAGVLGTVALASSATSFVIDAAAALAPRATAAWGNVRMGWTNTARYVGDMAEGAVSGAKKAVGGVVDGAANVLRGGKKLLGAFHW